MQIDEMHKINIYAGWNDLPILSNLSRCYFVFQNREFTSVEQAYMWHKASMFKDKEIAKRILSTDSTRIIKRLGSRIKNFDAKYWDAKAYNIMKALIRASLQQNYRKRKALTSTGNALLTHIPETSRWREDFPKILMELRTELQND